MRRSDFADLPPLVLETEAGEEEVTDFPAIAKAYAEAIASKKLLANKYMILAAQRYLDMLEMANDKGNDFYFSDLHVVDYCLFAEKFHHFESGYWELTQIGEDGEPDPRIILEPCQIWAEAAIHGFRRAGTGERLVKTALEMVPRKNAKSLKASIAALYDLCCSGQKGPEIPIAAATVKQATDTLFGDILSIVKNEPDLVEEYGLTYTTQEIRRGEGKIFIVSSQGERIDGLNPSLALFEEGHAGAISVYKVIDSAFGARPNSLRRMITTAGYRPEGPGWDLQLDAQRILEGKAEDYTLFAAIYTLDKEDYLNPETNAIEWDRLLTDESLIAKANPMYGISLDPYQIKSDMAKAQRRPDLKGEAARTRFNIWTGAGTSLVELTSWVACEADIALEEFMGQRCWIGVDLASFNDMCAIALLFERGDKIAIFAKYFIPGGSSLLTEPEYADLMHSWHESGVLTITEGAEPDYDRIESEIEVYCEFFSVEGIAFDPYQSNQISKRIFDHGVSVYRYPNNARTMTTPADDILGRIANKRLMHDGNPILAWNASNTYGERKGNGSILPRKESENSKRKIDGFVAACMANGLRLGADATPEKTDSKYVDPYADRGIVNFEYGDFHAQ